MKGFIEVYDQRTQFLKDIFLSHGYQINDKQAQNLDFYVVKNQKIDHDNTFSLNNINCAIDITMLNRILKIEPIITK